jgi:hypothetical protein
MKFFCVSLLCALCLSSSSAVPQEVQAVSLTDKSGTGSPFEVSGTASLREVATANELEWSWGERVSAKNISGKPIVLFIATLAEIGRHPATAGHHSAPGNGPTYQLEDDRFFNEKLIQPHELLVLRDTMPGPPESACCINPLSDLHPASAEFRVQFVQFADGSTFGDPVDAEDAFAIRRTIQNGLRELSQSYANHGSAGFVETLKQQSAFSATGIYRQIFSKYSSAGVSEAIHETKEMLATAERHAALIAGSNAPFSER